jgi:hypothetical protein
LVPLVGIELTTYRLQGGIRGHLSTLTRIYLSLFFKDLP